MNITFTSIISNSNNNDKIQFTTSAVVYQENNFTIFEFIEPDKKILNRIEVSPLFINIFSGPNTINLALNKKLQLDYEFPNGNIILESKMTKNNITKKIIKFEYDLYNANKILGNYKITLKMN